MGIEPTSSAWKAEVLPLNYTRHSLSRFCRALFPSSYTFFERAKILTVFTCQTVRMSCLFVVFPSVKLPTQLLTWFRLCLAAAALQRSRFGKRMSLILLYFRSPLSSAFKYLVEGVGFEPT